jgi:hypothetical protein
MIDHVTLICTVSGYVYILDWLANVGLSNTQPVCTTPIDPPLVLHILIVYVQIPCDFRVIIIIVVRETLRFGEVNFHCM